MLLHPPAGIHCLHFAKKVYNSSMQKLFFILAVFCLVGCAATQQSNYVIPQHIKDRHIEKLYHRAVNCMAFEAGEVGGNPFVNGAKEPNAMANNDNEIVLTEGLFQFNDDTITFVIAHELSHIKLKHIRNRKAVSIATTGVFMVAGFFIPGVGLLNYAANPAVTNNYSKVQEYEADKLASETLISCFNISLDKQIQILESMQSGTTDAGGFWDQHPAWSDRIENIKKAP
jgi:Zn-dependent protease with chaperone function